MKLQVATGLEFAKGNLQLLLNEPLGKLSCEFVK